MSHRLVLVWAIAVIVMAPVAGRTAEPLAGAETYKKRCAICHRPNGEGVAGVYPPLDQTLGHFMVVQSGRDYLVDVVVVGLGGTITVGEKKYIGQMKLVPPLADQEAADVLNYVLATFNQASLPADSRPFDAMEIATRRATPQTPTEIAKRRQSIVAELESLGIAR
ncbi:MAG: c-type cytochrome [Dongiaceae bacterium]